MDDRNRKIIEEYRANRGHLGGRSDGASLLLLLTTTGARTGRDHTNPLTYLPEGDRFVIFASSGGGPRNPDWYHNIMANSLATIEVGAENFQVRAVLASGDERDMLYARHAARLPIFAEYEKKTTRVIPVVILERVQ